MRVRLGLLVLSLVVFASAASTRAENVPALSALVQAHDWVNGRPSQRELSGKVVLVDFYTFNCINCKHTEPNLRALFRTTPRRDLVIIGVHTPETGYERDRNNLVASLKEQGIAWPVVVDNDNAVWDAYGVQAWPTQLVFDRRGTLRLTVVGEGQDEMLDRTVRDLIAQR